ncbi:Transcriptional regulator AcuR [Bacillus paralicheniformis]|nr:Transcriptional regulator AcuR [Bacillus paralicheniformis]TWK85718.1 Transcriptional regulator AcuR [Bacillus paralicheniformis]TWK91863.1 Transcriptional regulator AcuR [Bacillus paralicheniformis]
MVEQGLLDSFDTKKDAQAIVAMIEGGILLMKNQQNVNFLSDIIEVIRKQFNLE